APLHDRPGAATRRRQLARPLSAVLERHARIARGLCRALTRAVETKADHRLDSSFGGRYAPLLRVCSRCGPNRGTCCNGGDRRASNASERTPIYGPAVRIGSTIGCPKAEY